MAQFSNELKIGITVVGAILVAVVGFRYMKDVPLFQESHRITATFHRVDGLNPGSYVYVNGVKVGSVKDIKLMPDDSVRISMNIDLDNKIPKGSTALLKSMDLLGSKAVVIQKSDSREYVKSGGEINGEYVEGMMSTLKDEGEKLGGNISNSFDHFNRLLERLNKVVNQPNRVKLRKTLTNMRISTNKIASIVESKQNEIRQSIQHAHDFLETIDTLSSSNRRQIDRTLKSLQKASRDLAVLTHDLRQTSSQLNTIIGKINKGKGSAGLFINDPSLYRNLDTLAVNLKHLSREVNKNPQRFLQYMRMIEIF